MTVQVLVNGVLTNLTNVVSVTAGQAHTCALQAPARLVSPDFAVGLPTVLCWGSNGRGQLGDGTTNERSSPVPVISDVFTKLTGVVSVTAGSFHTCAVMVDSTVRCWGDNNNGQLGNDGGAGVLPFAVPVKTRNNNALTDLTTVVSATAGSLHTCALLTSGTARCWGSNEFGQIGNPDFVFAPTAVVVSSLTTAVSIAAGHLHTCALLADATIKCWGNNSEGQLGLGSNAPLKLFSPTPVTELTSVVALAGGGEHTCALLGDGTIRCWGDNSAGQLGIVPSGGNQPSPPPVSVAGLGGVVAVTTGSVHTCSLQSNDAIRCWGRNLLGQLGNGGPPPRADSTTPVAVAGGTGSISGRGIAAGGQHTCARRASGTAACWGDDGRGQLGDATTTDRSSPVTVVLQIFNPFTGLSTNVTVTNIVALAAGGFHTCALSGNGTVRCWGFNGNGQLGNGGTTELHSAPGAAISGLSNVVSVVAGGFHACALLVGGTVQCWGFNGSGGLGDGTTTDRHAPVPVTGLNNVGVLTNAIAIAAGEFHTCALLATGTVRCWGDNRQGQLGSSQLPSQFSSTPVPVLGGLNNAVAIAAGRAHTCAVLAGGKVSCWGLNDNGQVGDGSTADRTIPVTVRQFAPGGGTPTLVDLNGIVALEAGLQHTCALHANTTVFCWGDNSRGQLGNDSLVDSHAAETTPVLEIGFLENRSILNGIVALGVGNQHSCALRVDGQLFCWGSNSSGQIGIGAFSFSFGVGSPVSSFPFNIDPNVIFEHNGRLAEVTVLANCPADSKAHIRVALTQSGIGSGHTVGRCTGALERYEVTVHAQGRERFHSGTAHAEAVAIIRDRGQVVDTQEWTRDVELAFETRHDD